MIGVFKFAWVPTYFAIDDVISTTRTYHFVRTLSTDDWLNVRFHRRTHWNILASCSFLLWTLLLILISMRIATGQRLLVDLCVTRVGAAVALANLGCVCIWIYILLILLFFLFRLCLACLLPVSVLFKTEWYGGCVRALFWFKYWLLSWRGVLIEDVWGVFWD